MSSWIVKYKLNNREKEFNFLLQHKLLDLFIFAITYNM